MRRGACRGDDRREVEATPAPSPKHTNLKIQVRVHRGADVPLARLLRWRGWLAGVRFESPTCNSSRKAMAPHDGSQKVDTLGIEPRASRMLSGCDTTTPCARDDAWASTCTRNAASPEANSAIVKTSRRLPRRPYMQPIIYVCTRTPLPSSSHASIHASVHPPSQPGIHPVGDPPVHSAIHPRT